ncbi:DUF3106 domain-containing protein [Planctomycetales bacterium ZRK34]|nr:DUF3106 domain-containing protein [Planctomycetales bacterium ZRK34]
MNRKTVISLLIAITCLSVGGYLIYDHRASIPPDLTSASPDELIAFMLSDYFNRLSPEDQRRYTEAAMKRYATMTDEQRELVEARIKTMREDNPEQLREQAMRVWKQFVVNEAEQYVQLPPEQRGAWLDGRIAMWKAMGANGRGPKGESEERRREREKRQNEPISIDKQEKVITFFQDEVFPRTSARERALVLTLIRDAAPKMRPQD